MFWTNEIQEAWNENGHRIQGETICSGEQMDSLVSLKTREVPGDSDEVAEKFTTSGFKVGLTAHKSHGPARISVILRPSENEGEWWVSPFGTHNSDERGCFVGADWSNNNIPSCWLLVSKENLDYVVRQSCQRRRSDARRIVARSA